MIVGCPPSVVRRASSVVNNFFQRTSPKLLTGFIPNLEEMILIWPSLIIVQMIMVRCISRSHRLNVDFKEENFKNLPV